MHSWACLIAPSSSLWCLNSQYNCLFLLPFSLPLILFQQHWSDAVPPRSKHVKKPQHKLKNLYVLGYDVCCPEIPQFTQMSSQMIHSLTTHCCASHPPTIYSTLTLIYFSYAFTTTYLPICTCVYLLTLFLLPSRVQAPWEQKPYLIA